MRAHADGTTAFEFTRGMAVITCDSQGVQNTGSTALGLSFGLAAYHSSIVMLLQVRFRVIHTASLLSAQRACIHPYFISWRCSFFLPCLLRLFLQHAGVARFWMHLEALQPLFKEICLSGLMKDKVEAFSPPLCSSA